MRRIAGILLVVLLELFVGTDRECNGGPGNVAEQYEALLKDYLDVGQLLAKAVSDEARKQLSERHTTVARQILELAEKNPKEPVAVDALVEMVWRSMPGSDKALALLQREHARSPRIAQVRVQTAFGAPIKVTIMQQVACFRSKEAETFLRTILETNPDREAQAQACIALAAFHANQGRKKEAEAQYEQAIDTFGDVKYVSGGTVGEKARGALFVMRELTVTKQAPEIEGEDQDGRRLKLSDYRGKVVLLYFWHEF
jgi:hypothetical protein